MKGIKDYHRAVKAAAKGKGATLRLVRGSVPETHKCCCGTHETSTMCVKSNGVYSKRHIGVWTNDGASLTCKDLLPKWSEKEDNVLFGNKIQILETSKKGPSKEILAEGGGEDGDIAKESPSEDGEDEDDDDSDTPEGMRYAN